MRAVACGASLLRAGQWVCILSGSALLSPPSLFYARISAMLVAPTVSTLENPTVLPLASTLAEFFVLQLLFGFEKLMPLELFPDFPACRNGALS